MSVRMIARWLRSRGAHEDRGVALVMAISTVIVLGALALTTLAYVVRSEKQSRYDQDYSAALTAAQAGVDDFISRLNRDDIYYATLDCDNQAMPQPTSITNKCGWTSSTAVGWVAVDSTRTRPKDAFFHYTFDPSRVGSEGSILLTVTGRSNRVYRTVEATVGKGGSTDYVYYTDFESADPANTYYYPNGASKACGGQGYQNASYWWSDPSRSKSSCSEITFASGDTLNGSVFSNDAMWSDGATFLKQVNSANPDCLLVTAQTSSWAKCLRNSNGSSSTGNFSGIKPAYQDKLSLDDTSAQFANDPGCHYYGSTRIRLNADGTMTVWNKYANHGAGAVGAPVGTAAEGGSAPICGDVVRMDSDSGDTVAVPNDLVVYVAEAPATVTRAQCSAGQLGGPTGATLPLGTYTSSLVASKNATYTYDDAMRDAVKTCQSGNLYLEGVLQGRVTFAAAQSIVMTGDLVLAGGMNGTDMAGLVATNSVEAIHPWLKTVAATQCTAWKSDGACKTTGTTWRWDVDHPTGGSEQSGWPRQYDDPTPGAVQFKGLQIAGSIQTLQHSFLVQRFDLGTSQGKLQVNGSIAQRWRGIVAKGSTGYVKNYVYDPRLQFAAPPYFPRWINAQWKQRYFGEIQTDSTVKK